MPVEIVTTDRKFYTQFKNGDTFAANLGDFTTNLAGIVIEKVKAIHQVDVEWFAQASSASPFEFENLGSDLFRYKKQNGGSFIDDGFAVGDDIDTFTPGVTPIDGDVVTIDDEWMYIQFSVSHTVSSGVTTTTTIAGKSDLTTLIYRFGLIDNDDTVFSSVSKVSGNDQSYYADSLVVAGGAVPMISQGQYKDWVTGSATVDRVTNPSTYVQRFTITHELTIVPYYLDGQLSNLQDNVIPDLLSGLASLKYVINYEFRTAKSNPNTKKEAQDIINLGSVGWFNENFNGFENDYSITSISYTDAALNSADGVILDSETIVTMKVKKTSGAFVTSDKIGVSFAYLAEVADYQNTVTTQEVNFMFDNLYTLAGGTPTAGTGIISEITATINTGDIDLVFKIEHTAAQKITLSQKTDPNYLIAVNVGNITKTNKESDRVALIADAKAYDVNADIPGLITLNDFRFFAEDEVVGVDTGHTDLIGWNEDDFACAFDFDLNLNKLASLKTLEIHLLAYNSVTEQYFSLDSYLFNVSNPVVSEGVQQFNISDTRNYTLADGSQFNEVELLTGSQAAGLQNYTGKFAQKISWQTWISNINADSVFFDNSKPNDNLNFKASNYSNLNDYDIKIGIFANVFGENTTLQTSGNTDYLILTPDIIVYDYNKDGNPSPVWTATIETFDESETNNLGGEILTNGDNTLVKTTFTGLTVSDVSNYWATHKAEQANDPGYNIEKLSSINLPPSSQLPIPIGVLTLLDIQAVSGDVITKSLIDGSLVAAGINYNLSSRLQTPNAIMSGKIFTFKTESLTPDTFDPVIAKSGAVADWDLGDGTPFSGNNVSHTYTLAGTKTVEMICDDLLNVTTMTFNDDDIVEGIQLRPFKNVTSFIFWGNPNLTSVTNPATSTVITRYDIYNCNLSTLNVSGLTGLSGIFQAQGNSSLTTITNPISSGVFTLYKASLCNLTGTLDISGLTGLGGIFTMFGNSNLTSITNPTSTQTFTMYQVEQCGLTTLDISGLSNLGGLFSCFDNPNLTSITNPTSTQTFTNYLANDCDLAYFDLTPLSNLTESNSVSIRLEDNSMTAAEVNQMLVDLDSMSTGGFSSRIIDISGTNAAPDGTSGGFDGLTAKANLITKTFTVTTS